MKRSQCDPENESPSNKVMLVERASAPGGVALVNPRRVSEKTYTELMELDVQNDIAKQFTKTNLSKKLEMIARQIENLQETAIDVVMEYKETYDLNHAACNFVKKPGHVYHLYERPSGQRYFSMLSPEEWVNVPHQFVGSFRLGTDYSWKPADWVKPKYKGLEFLRNFVDENRMKERLNSRSNFE